MSIEHSVIGDGEIHIAPNWTVANAAELAALSLTTSDGGKLAYQEDTKTLLLLLSSSPVNWLVVNPVVQPDHTTALLSGGQVSYQGNLDFLVTAATYEILGIPYSSAQTTLTLDTADVTDPRIDAIVLDNTGTAVVVKGTAASTPSTPYIDPASQLEIATITVPAGATSITAATNTLLYDENAGTPTEWATSALSGSWDFANTTAPLNGTKDILGAAITAGQTMQLAAATPVDLSTYVNGVLVLPVRVVSAWSSGRGIGVTWFSSGVQKGITISVQDGVFGFSRTNTSAYQYVVIPLVQFGVLPGVTVNQLRIACFGGTIALRLDWIRLQGSAITTVTTGTGLTQTQADARYFQIANNLSEGTAATVRTNIGLGTVATLASDTDGTLAANSDTRVATQKAVKTYADTKTPPSAANPTGTIGATAVNGAASTFMRSDAAPPLAIASLTGKTTPVDADITVIADSAASNALKGLTLANLKTYIGKTGGVQVVLGDGTNAITTGEPYIDLVFPFAVTLASWELTADASGAIQLNLWKCTYAQYDGGSTHPVSGDNICASAPPIITASATKQNSGDTPMTGWTTAVSAGDRIRVSVASATTVKRVTFEMGYTR